MRLFVWLGMLAFAALCTTGCGKCTRPASALQIDSDDVLRYNALQVKGTHNSYHVEPIPSILPTWRYTHAALSDQLNDQGVRQFELDVHYQPSTGQFDVFHLAHIDARTTCKTLVDCLSQLKIWSDAHAGHLPLFVLLEPKFAREDSTVETIFAELEHEILSVWPREQIVTPNDVQGGFPSLSVAVSERGWPTIGELRGKIMFALDDKAKIRESYTHGEADLDGRLAFAVSDTDAPYASIFVLDDPIRSWQRIHSLVKENFLVRTRADENLAEAADDDVTRLEAAMSSGAQFISTDFPVAAAASAYHVELQGGAPVRCNPVLDPANCDSTALNRFERHPDGAVFSLGLGGR